MALSNTNNNAQNDTQSDPQNNFDPTPKLKSSSEQILFIPFNNQEVKCEYCKNELCHTNLYNQKYCIKCLFKYIKKITKDNNICIFKEISKYLDLQVCNPCNEQKNCGCTKNIQEFEFSSKISHFKQIITNHSFNFIKTETEKLNEIIKKERNCKLCKKRIYNDSFYNELKFKLCSECYLISSEFMESVLTKKNPTLVLYLPWWDTCNQCVVCKLSLKFTSDCQKFCPHCYLIYTGCRYCLTTNIIFGITSQSQCKKCQRIIYIFIDRNINSESVDIEEFLIYTRLDMLDINYDIIIHCLNKNSCPLDKFKYIIDMIRNAFPKPIIEWIPYSRITNLNKIAEGGFGIIYKATWNHDGKYQHEDFLSIRNKDKTVAIKKFRYSQHLSKYFLNELSSLHKCYNTDRIIKYYGITKDPETKDYMLIMNYAFGGDLHNYLRKNFMNITWDKKLYILWQISDGLHVIHEKEFIHRDFHSGNILLETESAGKWLIGDLGLTQPKNTTANNEIYGVIPYIAPEIFNGSSFSKESDIYSLGMIMWEMTTGCKPFADVEHDFNLVFQVLDGIRPKITDDTPECFANLMEKCWNSNPEKRPSITTIRGMFYDWSFKSIDIKQYTSAEAKRLELIELKKLGPEFSKKFHPKAIFTSKSLNSFISNFSSNCKIDSKLKFENEEFKLAEYKSLELKCDIDIQSSTIQDIPHQNSFSKPLKRKIEDIKVEHCSGKYLKIDQIMNND